MTNWCQLKIPTGNDSALRSNQESSFLLTAVEVASISLAGLYSGGYKFFLCKSYFLSATDWETDLASASGLISAVCYPGQMFTNCYDEYLG